MERSQFAVVLLAVVLSAAVTSILLPRGVTPARAQVVVGQETGVGRYVIVPLQHDPAGTVTVNVQQGEGGGVERAEPERPFRDVRDGSNAILLNTETGATWVIRSDDNASNYRWLSIAR